MNEYLSGMGFAISCASYIEKPIIDGLEDISEKTRRDFFVRNTKSFLPALTDNPFAKEFLEKVIENYSKPSSP